MLTKMDVVSSQARDTDPAVPVIEDDPAKASQALAFIRGVLDRMERMERIATGMPLRRSLRPAYGMQKRVLARVRIQAGRPRAPRRGRRVRSLANRRVVRARGRDPDLPHHSTLARRVSAKLARHASRNSALATSFRDWR